MSDCVEGEEVAVDRQLTGEGERACVSWELTEDTGEAERGLLSMPLVAILGGGGSHSP